MSPKKPKMQTRNFATFIFLEIFTIENQKLMMHTKEVDYLQKGIFNRFNFLLLKYLKINVLFSLELGSGKRNRW